MPLDLGAMSNDVVALNIEYGGEKGSVTYRPTNITMAWSEEISEAARVEDMRELARLMSQVIDEWDFVVNGSPIEISEKGLMELPAALFSVITQGITEDANRRARIVRPSQRSDSVLSKLFGPSTEGR